MNKLKVSVSGDIGCYTLGAAAPLSAMDTTIDMGASISMLHGRIKARPECAKTTVAVIGDSTFIHSGLTGLINITYNNSPATVIIADNSITGMTGHQRTRLQASTIKNQQTNAVTWKKRCVPAACAVYVLSIRMIQRRWNKSCGRSLRQRSRLLLFPAVPARF